MYELAPFLKGAGPLFRRLGLETELGLVGLGLVLGLADRRNSGNSTYATVNFRIDAVGGTFRLTDS